MDGESYSVTPKGVSVEVRHVGAGYCLCPSGACIREQTEFIEIHGVGSRSGLFLRIVNCGNCAPIRIHRYSNTGMITTMPS